MSTFFRENAAVGMMEIRLGEGLIRAARIVHDADVRLVDVGNAREARGIRLAAEDSLAGLEVIIGQGQLRLALRRARDAADRHIEGIGLRVLHERIPRRIDDFQLAAER